VVVVVDDWTYDKHMMGFDFWLRNFQVETYSGKLLAPTKFLVKKIK